MMCMKQLLSATLVTLCHVVASHTSSAYASAAFHTSNVFTKVGTKPSSFLVTTIGLTSSTSVMAANPTIEVEQFMTNESRPAETKDFIMQQTMLRVKDPIQSLNFYCNVLGFRLIHYSEFPQWKFNVYFVAPVRDSAKPTSGERWTHCMNTPGCIELTWNYGSEKEEGKVYNTGNADATGTGDGGKVRGGFGHIGITVPNVYKACERFHSLGVEFHKSPNSGGMKGLAFIKDPDGYLVEVLPQGDMVAEAVDCLGVLLEGGEGYKDNSK